MNLKKMLDREFFIHALKFGLVGALNTAICYVIIIVLYQLLHVDYNIANTLGYMIGLVNSFIMNKNWTFNNQGKMSGLLPKFLAVWLICFLVESFLASQLKSHKVFNVYIITLLANVVFTGLNFIGNKYISFVKKNS